MSDPRGPEYYQRIRRLRQAASAQRGPHAAVHRLRAALVPVADRLLAQTGHASFLADSRAVANELVARYLFLQLGALPDAPTLFLAVAEALHEALSRQARTLADRPPAAEVAATGTRDTVRGAATVSTIIDVRHNPHSFLAQAERFHRLRVHKPQEAVICLLRRFAGRTPAEVAHLLGREERVVEDCLALFEQFDLAP